LKSFHPTISEKSHSLVRTSRVDEELYQDAKSRKEKTKKPITRPEDSKKSKGPADIHAWNKFEKDFNTCYDKVDKGSNVPLTLQQVGEFCQQFGCLVNNKQGEEGEMLQEMWKILEGENRGGVNGKSMLEFMIAILQIQPPSPDDQKSKEKTEPAPQGKELSFNSEGVLVIPASCAQTLHKKFYQFYVNKRFNAPTKNTKIAPDTLPFKPTISTTTVKLAAKSKAKNNFDENIPVEDKLLEQQKTANS
jgi:hypothetical protein